MAFWILRTNLSSRRSVTAQIVQGRGMTASDKNEKRDSCISIKYRYASGIRERQIPGTSEPNNSPQSSTRFPSRHTSLLLLQSVSPHTEPHASTSRPPPTNHEARPVSDQKTLLLLISAGARGQPFQPPVHEYSMDTALCWSYQSIYLYLTAGHCCQTPDNRVARDGVHQLQA